MAFANIQLINNNLFKKSSLAVVKDVVQFSVLHLLN